MVLSMVPQGLKPTFSFVAFAAQLKSSPVTKRIL
jgi:hypothetical protein